MRKIYLRMALNSISKNRVIYIPYILSSSLMGMIIYFVMALANDPIIIDLNGGVDFETIISYGSIVFTVLAIIFVFYLSFFISRNKRKEYGVLSVLGMEKKHILYMIFLENSILAIADIICSCIGGVVFYKMIQLILMKFLNGPTDYGLFVSIDAMIIVAAVFAAVSLMVFMVQAFRVWRSDAYSDMTSTYDREGIRTSDIVIAIIGIVCLVVSYEILLQMPYTFPGWDIFSYVSRFAIACLLLMAATFLLFSSGSVIFLTLLKRKKKFYYNKLNFINISSLIHRMRRNGVGLAFVSILSTLVIVTMTGIFVFAGYLGEYLEELSPVSFVVTDDSAGFEQEMASYGVEDFVAYPVNLSISYPCSVYGKTLKQKTIEQSPYVIGDDFYNIYDMTILMDVGSAENLLGKEITLADHQFGLVAVDSDGLNFKPAFDSIMDLNGEIYDYVLIEDEAMFSNYIGAGIILIYPGTAEETVDYYIDTVSSPDVDYVYDYVSGLYPGEKISKEEYRDRLLHSGLTMYALDVPITIQQEIYTTYVEENETPEAVIEVYSEATDFLTAFKALLVLCVMFLAVFIIMTVMLLYYRNLFDGYEDVKNYGIMRNIGLDDEIINRVVFIQVLITLVLPILVATVNTIVGERCILSVIRMYESSAAGDKYIMTVLASSFFAIIVYLFAGLIASRTYAKIVKGDKNTFNLN